MSAMNSGRVYFDSYFNGTVNSKICQNKFASPLLMTCLPRVKVGFSRGEEILEPNLLAKLERPQICDQVVFWRAFHLSLSLLSHRKDISDQFVNKKNAFFLVLFLFNTHNVLTLFPTLTSKRHFLL